MSKEKVRWCRKCDRLMPHDKIATLDGYTGHGAMWIDHLFYRSEIEEVWRCQRCKNKCTTRKY